MTWNVENTDEFTEWWNELTDAPQEGITATAELLMGAKRRSPDPDFLRIRPKALGDSADRWRQNRR
jgi:hypothetical protein